MIFFFIFIILFVFILLLGAIENKRITKEKEENFLEHEKLKKSYQELLTLASIPQGSKIIHIKYKPEILDLKCIDYIIWKDTNNLNFFPAETDDTLNLIKINPENIKLFQ